MEKVNFKDSTKKVLYTSLAALALLTAGGAATFAGTNVVNAAAPMAQAGPTSVQLGYYLADDPEDPGHMIFAEGMYTVKPNTTVSIPVPPMTGYTPNVKTVEVTFDASGKIVDQTYLEYAKNGSSTSQGSDSTSTDTGSTSTGSSTGSSSAGSGSTSTGSGTGSSSAGSGNTQTTKPSTSTGENKGGTTGTTNQNPAKTPAKSAGTQSGSGSSAVTTQAAGNTGASTSTGAAATKATTATPAKSTNTSTATGDKAGDVQTGVDGGMITAIVGGLTSGMSALGYAVRRRLMK